MEAHGYLVSTTRLEDFINHTKFYEWGETQNTTAVPEETEITDISVSDQDNYILNIQSMLESLTSILLSQSYSLDFWIDEFREIKALRERVEALLKHGEALTVEINRLPRKILSSPLTAIVEPDGDGFIARSPDLPLYGYSEDRIEAVEMLKDEIESLYEDLMEDDNFSEDYLKIKHFLIDRIVS